MRKLLWLWRLHWNSVVVVVVVIRVVIGTAADRFLDGLSIDRRRLSFGRYLSGVCNGVIDWSSGGCWCTRRVGVRVGVLLLTVGTVEVGVNTGR